MKRLSIEEKVSIACEYVRVKYPLMASFYFDPKQFYIVRYEDSGKLRYVMLNLLDKNPSEEAMVKTVEENTNYYRPFSGATRGEAFNKWKALIPGNPSISEMKLYLAITGK